MITMNTYVFNALDVISGSFCNSVNIKVLKIQHHLFLIIQFKFILSAKYFFNHLK